ncbi:MAG: hypothetical protein HC934_13220 [Acaryochloridaceae cyanobacterium SU_2_1]|nr:hypothetical protein [Acaryochloridaceae cyanobacterium SU_2_1]
MATDFIPEVSYAHYIGGILRLKSAQVQITLDRFNLVPQDSHQSMHNLRISGTLEVRG